MLESTPQIVQRKPGEPGGEKARMEQVAKELLARIKGNHTCQVCGHRRGQHAMDLVGDRFCEVDGPGECTCDNYVGVESPGYAELVAALEGVAGALAAAKLEEAKWWHLQVALAAMQSEIIDPGTRDECRERIEALERAAEGAK